MRLPIRPSAVAVALAAFAATGRAGPVEDALALLRADRPGAAERALTTHLDRAPDDLDAWRALGEVERKRCRLAVAEAAFARVLERDPADAGARAGLAEVRLQAGRAEEALALARAAADLRPAGRPEDGRPWRVVALALAELRRYDLAVEAARRAVALRPDDARCAEALAATLFRAGEMEACRAAYARAVALDPRAEEANLRLGNGFGPASDDRPWLDGEDAPAFREATAAWDRGDLESAARAFADLTARRPTAWKYRLGLGLARVSLRRRGEAWLGGDPVSLYLRVPAPEVEGLERVVPGFSRLRDAERHAVLVAVGPARAMLPAMAAAGATHEVLPLASDLSDAAARADLRGRRTFDGRWYAHLRGVGGAQGATGVEKLREAAEFGFHTFAHEWGHQVHRYGLAAPQRARVTALYAAAKARDAFLDYYAAADEDEYFAQGYEAFVSPLKRGCLTETARHTRTELGRRDPALLAFLVEVLDVAYESEDAMRALLAAARGEAEGPRPEPASR